MQRDPRDLVRYTPSERLNHWIVGISFILLGLSGLACSTRPSGPLPCSSVGEPGPASSIPTWGY